MTDWAIPQQAKLKYTQLFNLHDRSRSGFLSGLQCRDILMQSGLPRTILAEIWNLSDIDGDGQLTREEFMLAMHLTNQARAGQTLPQELPVDLVPPSYRRTRSISTTSLHSVTSSVGSSEPVPTAVAPLTTASSSINDDLPSQKSSEASLSNASAAGSILNTNSFEDKRRENFEKGRAELERRRLKIIEQQTSIISEQLVKCKKQVAEAKSKIDSMRTDRDTKAGLITSLEAQLQTIRERKAFLDHEELQIIEIARDLNLVNSPHSADLDQQATIAKQATIKQMKEKLVELEHQKDATVKQLAEASASLEESKKELKVVSGEVSKIYETYKEKIANAKVLRQQFIEESKSKPIDLQSVWDSTPNHAVTHDTNFKAESTGSFPPTEDPWSATSAFPDSRQPIDDPFASDGNKPVPQTTAASLNNNDFNFEPARDFNSFSSISPEQKEQSTNKASNSSNELSAPESTQRKKMYRVLYEFEARNPDELTINPGDIIIGSEVVCEPGWLSGETNGRSGLFPEAYVEPLAADEMPTQTSNIEPSLSTNDPVNIQGTSGFSPQGPPRQASPSKSTIVKYKVIYAFEARNPDELTINPGDIITGVDLPHEPGWLMGELNAQRGLFPEAYVEQLAEAQNDSSAEPAGTLRRGSSSGSLRSKKSRGKKAEVATVIANYRALGQEQLNLEKGQLVLIRRKMDSGWWEGELQIKVAIGRDGNELDHLISELVDSELDYVNDLRLCQNAYIKSLSTTFDVSHIFTNWPKLIEHHESALRRIYEESCADCNVTERPDAGQIGYCFVFETFQMLLNSIVDLYVEFCSRQLDATRQLEAKMVSDIRFRQLVNESQRKLRKLIENNNSSCSSLVGENNDEQTDQSLERALRNANLPLTTFLLKPMQRITKYQLLFDRMLKLLKVNQRHVSLLGSSLSHRQEMLDRLGHLLENAQMLCKQVNEACRLKEDDQDNAKRLRWCQSHILQPALNQFSGSSEQHQVRPYSVSSSPLGISEMRMSSEFMRSQPSSDSLVYNTSLISMEQIQFESKTNCLGPRRLIKAGSLCKFRSNRELVVYLFNDFILLTQIKGGASLRVSDVFKSERAQQAYYKYYRYPILLEDVQMGNFDNDQLELPNQSSSLLACPSLVTPISPAKDQENLVVSFLDRSCGVIYNLLAMSSKEKESWTKLLGDGIDQAREAREEYQRQNLLLATKRLKIADCYGRLFVTVLELVQVSTQPINSTLDRRNSWTNRLTCATGAVQNLCIRLQLRLYKKAHVILDDSERREIIPLSDEFKTKTIAVGQALRQPAMVDMNEVSMGDLDIQRDTYKFSDADCTQFLLGSSVLAEGLEYLDIELLDDSRLRETRQLGRKRISLDQLLDRGADQSRAGDKSPVSSRRDSSTRSGRGVQPLQANRPVEMTLKLKTIARDNSDQVNGAGSTNSAAKARPIAGFTNGNGHQTQLPARYNVKLRLQLQMFCDTDDLI